MEGFQHMAWGRLVVRHTSTTPASNLNKLRFDANNLHSRTSSFARSLISLCIVGYKQIGASMSYCGALARRDCTYMIAYDGVMFEVNNERLWVILPCLNVPG